MNLVILDSYALKEGDLDWSEAYTLADNVTAYARTTYSDAYERLKNADLAICNKCRIDEELLKKLPKLKWIGETSTGTDNVDLAACAKYDVRVANVPGYSTHSVAQLTFALLLQICRCTQRHEAALRAGYWQADVPQSFGIMPQVELYSKTMGIIGFGDIGIQTAKIATAFGMNVICYTKSVHKAENVSFVAKDKLLQCADIISLHCPLTDETREIINEKAIEKMKQGAFLINTSRGALVNEEAIAKALLNGKLAAYGSDVFSIEPIKADNPILSAPNTFITPHIAWATREALARLSQEVCGNLKAFISGNMRNVLN